MSRLARMRGARRPAATMAAVMTSAMLLAACLALAGCPFASDTPLGDAASAELDGALVGSWVMADAETGEKIPLKFLPFNDHELVAVGADEGSAPLEVAAFRVFTTRIDGVSFLNIAELGEHGAEEWYFARYERHGDSLSLRIVDDALFSSTHFGSSAELAEFVRRNLSNTMLYGGTESEEPPTVLTRP